MAKLFPMVIQVFNIHFLIFIFNYFFYFLFQVVVVKKKYFQKQLIKSGNFPQADL